MLLAQMVVGWILWDRKCETVYRGRIYTQLPDAEKVRAGIVWHSRERYELRQCLLGGVEQEPKKYGTAYGTENHSTPHDSP